MGATAKHAGVVPVAEFHDYQTLHAALRLAREKRNISFELWDRLAGTSDGYTT
jgi:hypothetical protein